MIYYRTGNVTDIHKWIGKAKEAFQKLIILERKSGRSH